MLLNLEKISNPQSGLVIRGQLVCCCMDDTTGHISPPAPKGPYPSGGNHYCCGIEFIYENFYNIGYSKLNHYDIVRESQWLV